MTHISGAHGRSFADELAQLALRVDDPRCAALARRLRRPVTVTVRGRPGVGVRTVARALTAAGVAVRTETSAHTAEPEVEIRVIAETAQPEDLAAGPDLFILNKADLAGFGDGGPMAVSRAHAAELTRRTGTPVEPLAALPAVAALEPAVVDDRLLSALRTLVSAPADMSSPDAFVAGPHPLPGADRRRLVERLDLFGIAHAVLAVAESGTVDVAALRRASRIDAVCARIDAVAAEVRYRRMLGVVAELEVLAVRVPEVARFLAADATVAARTAAAAAVIAAAGLPAPPEFGAERGSADVRAAVRWRRYGSGPVTAVHRACAADLTRAALRAAAR